MIAAGRNPSMRTLRTLLLALLACLASGCTSFHAVALDDARRELEPGDTIRVTLHDGRVQQHEVGSVHAGGIAITGRTLPFEEIAVLERERVDWLRSFGLFLAVNVVLLVIDLQDGGLYD
jgi:hypothetical protein